MSIKKKYLKSRPVCKVTFQLPKGNGRVQDAFVVGDFNNWQTDATPLKRQKDGKLAATVELESGREYQFRYFLNGEKWANDDAADGAAPTAYPDTENSVVAV